MKVEIVMWQYRQVTERNSLRHRYSYMEGSLVVLSVDQKGTSLWNIAPVAFSNSRNVSFELKDKFDSGQAQGRVEGRYTSLVSPIVQIFCGTWCQQWNPLTNTSTHWASHISGRLPSPQKTGGFFWRDRHNVLLTLFQWNIEIMPWELNCHFFSNQH